MHRISTARLRNSLLAVFLLAMLAFLTPAFSQSTSTSGSIKGNITDPQGAAVPGATVVTTNTGTGFSRTVTSGGQGEFTVADIPIGSYGVTITKPGFKEFDLKNVIVNVSNISNVIANLQLGNVSEQVTVEASAIQVQTSSAAVGEVVDGRQVAELPLNGSNFVELTQLQPGVSHANNFSTANKGLLGGVDFSVNGNPVTNNLFLIDGATNNDVGSNRTILVYPSVDAIAEFKMLRNSYGPEYGQASGAVISIVTKGGTNQFHGTVTYYGRNDAVGAEDYFAKEHNNAVVAAGGSLPHNGKDELRRNDVIWSLGGPIKKDKLFFFVSQEFNREIQGYTRSSCVPSAAELSGDFSGGASCGAALPLAIPVADQAPGNPLKIATPSPAGLLIGQLLPTPNTPPSIATGGNNWFLSTGSPLNFREENARVDYNVAANQLLTFRYTQDHWVNPAPNTAPNGYLWGDDPFPAVEGNWSQPSKSAIAKLTSTIGSSMVNEAQFSYAGNAIVTTAGGSTPGLAQKINGAFPTVFPGSVKGLNGIPTIWGGLGAYGNGANLWSIAPYANNMDLYTVRDDISKIKGSHAIKAGVFLSFNAKNENQYGGQDRPAFSTADAAWAISNPTGNQLADLLLPGQAFSMAEQNINPVDQARWRDYEFYVGDTWKAKPNLTIEYGARYSFYREPVDATNAVGVFSPAAFDPAAINVPGPGGTTGPNICNGIVVVPGTTFCQQAANLTGFAYTAGTPSQYGRALVPNANHDIAPRLGISWDPFNTGKTAIRAGVGQFYQRERVSTQVGISNSPPFAITVNSNRTLDAVPPASTIVYGGGASNSRNPRSVTPNSWQWNLMIEQELAKNTALEVGYIGNKGIHLTSIYDQNATNDRANGAFNANGALNPFRPYPIFGAIYTADRNGWSNYHALQVLFRTRWEDHVNVQVAYTWSHSISNIDLAASNGLGSNASNITDPLNPNLDKGNSTINRPQMLVTNATFYLPKLNAANGLERNVLGGWELATIASFEDGNSITAYAVTNGQFSNLFGTGYGNNNRPLIVAGQGCNSGTHGEYVLNPNAFTLNNYTIGTDNNPALEPRGYCSAPGLQNVDLAVYKTFKLTERVNLQFRLDGFNALNHVNFRGDQINTDWANFATVTCGTAACGPKNTLITNSTIPAVNNFGRATGDAGPRQIQYGLKLTF